ncbi:hypothetical protein [Microbispora sp. GKU 823]|uniref:hypothetical protein n=1 Tax=Microbispora sp. GKU 823 TaxID=1652100 RepID=UPI0009CE9A38|nr:hypothetical protein [Microbispora sp. GKU 823]OPG01915.1 hypothetical protein B1L11_43530 [Microbispora sp. GKU 823]
MDLFDSGPERLRLSNSSDSCSDGSDGWWDRLTSGSPLWSSEGSAAREHASQDTSDDAPGAGQGRARSSWVLVGSLRESAQELALAPLPDDVDICLAEAEELMFARGSDHVCSC